MAIVPYLDADDVAPEHRALLARPINLFRALINAPEGLTRFHALAEWIRWECELDPRLRELIILQVGALTREPYEWSHHVELSRQFGVTDADLRAVLGLAAGGTGDLGPDERIALEATAQLVHDGALSDDVVARLLARFTPQQITEIVLIASFYCMVVRVLGGLRIEVEPEYAAHLERFPLPAPAGGSDAEGEV